MRPTRINITGSSGSGAITLGHLLANMLDYPHFDSDNFYWTPTAVPYRVKRERADRPDRVLSGSMMDWADALPPARSRGLSLCSSEARQSRLRIPESKHFGADAVAPGGRCHEETEDVVAWASHYENGTRDGRNQVEHDTWLGALACPVLGHDASPSLEALVDDIAACLVANGSQRKPWDNAAP